MSYYFTYVLFSRRDNSFYTGWTNNLKSRYKNHKNGKVKATKYRLPLELVYFEGCLSRDLAIKREKQLKTGYGRAYLKRKLLLE